MLPLSDSAMLVGTPATVPLPYVPLLLPGTVAPDAPGTAALLAPGDADVLPDAELLPEGFVEPLPELDGAGAGGLPLCGLPVTPTPTLPLHGPWPTLSQAGGSGAMCAR